MGKVLDSFTNGFAGAIARSLDDVVVALSNKSEETLAFGVPVVLDATKAGVVPFDPDTHTGADFVGVTVRLPSKTPDAYGSAEGAYAPNDMVDVLVRGHIVAPIYNWTGALGDAVSIRKADGGFAVGTGDDYIPLPNVRVSAIPDGNSLAELLLTGRNVL